MNLKTDPLRTFLADTSGLAASEVAMVLPVLLTLLLGVVDLGNAMLVSKKSVTASQVVADLMTRHATASQADVDDAYAAARMAVQPFDTNNMGLDIASIRFVGAGATPTIVWRQTFNMEPNADALELATGLGVQNEGVLVITTQYAFEPVFTHAVIGERSMREVAVTRPRRGSYVTLEN